MQYTCEKCGKKFDTEEKCDAHEELCGLNEDEVHVMVTIKVYRSHVDVETRMVGPATYDWYEHQRYADCYPRVSEDGYIYLKYWQGEHDLKEALELVLAKTESELQYKKEELTEMTEEVRGWENGISALKQRIQQPREDTVAKGWRTLNEVNTAEGEEE